MQGKATFRGHPLHLMFVSFPVAAWTGAVATDLAGARSVDPFWYRMSVTLIAAGIATGALAAVFGYVDYRTVPMTRRAKRIATAHFVASLLTLAVYVAALVIRDSDAASFGGIALSYVGAALLFAGGYWGSELANRFHVGISNEIER
jgi:uncharacterized membrane protein